MRRLSIAILVVLSACASVPSDNDISKRKASWQGAPVDELVAAFGGQPGLKKEDKWYWQFWASPEKKDSYIRESESPSGLGGCDHCLNPVTSSVGSPSVKPSYFFGSGGGSARSPGSERPPICTYFVYVENGTIVKITTMSAPGAYCRFEELPLRPNKPELEVRRDLID